MKRILVIEDNQEIRENLIEILEFEEYVVLSANEGRSGFEIAITELPNLILCDVMMPQMDGHQVLDAVKTNPLTKNIPFIFITSSIEKKDVQCALDKGANTYIKKPFEVDELFKIIKTFFQNQEI